MDDLVARARSLWRGLRAPARLEREMDEEMRFHLEMEAERLVRERGLRPAEARRRAAVAFGGLDKHKEAGRDARGLTRLTGMGLDFRLGTRVVARYPGLTAISVAAMAFGIAIGAGGFEFVKDQLFPPLPYADADRVVQLRHVSTRTTRPEPRALHDFARWRAELRAVEHVSALAHRERVLALAPGERTPVAEAAVSASAFHLVRVAPLLGRPLVPGDEAAGAPPVTVLGHALWQRRFGGDPGVVGRVVRLGGEATTVVGVMPPHFTFFVPEQGIMVPAPQELWVPFRASPLDHSRGEGPAITVLAQLAPGATLDAARAEMAAAAAGAAREWPDTHGQATGEVLTFDHAFASSEGMVPAGMLSLSSAFLAVLMGILCANVALLVFARAATRQGEMTVRSALGASRGRVVFQLFAEALVLAGLALVVGLTAASLGLRWGVGVMREMFAAGGHTLPTWVEDTLSPSTVGYAALLCVVGAAVAGVLPGLKVTGPRPNASLQRLAGRGSGVRLSRVWTAIVVVQVALTALFVPVAAVLALQTAEMRRVGAALPAGGRLTAQLETDGGQAPAADEDAAGRAAPLARLDEGAGAVRRRLLAEPGIAGVALASAVPGSWHWRPKVEVDGAAGSAPAAAGQAQDAAVDAEFFRILGTPVVAGRGFVSADTAAGVRVVVVNESFVRELLGGRPAVGQRIRLGNDEQRPWHEIVGVVADVAMNIDPTLPHNAGVYRPLRAGEAYPLRLLVGVEGDAAAFAGRLHELAAEAAPALRLRRPLPLERAADGMLIAQGAWLRVVLLGGAMALLLTNAGIYAVISFTVSRRTREIGVRVALGADRRRIVASLLARTARHVGVGVAVGGVLSFVLAIGLSEGTLMPTPLQGGALLAAYMAMMLALCMAACIVPTRRALRIEPMEALNTDG